MVSLLGSAMVEMAKCTNFIRIGKTKCLPEANHSHGGRFSRRPFQGPRQGRPVKRHREHAKNYHPGSSRALGQWPCRLHTIQCPIITMAFSILYIAPTRARAPEQSPSWPGSALAIFSMQTKTICTNDWGNTIYLIPRSVVWSAMHITASGVHIAFVPPLPFSSA